MFESVAVAGRVRPILCADAADITCGTWPDSIERTTTPIIYIVPTGKFRQFALTAGAARKICHFVLFEAACLRRVNERFVHVARHLFIRRKLARLQLGKQWG